jgi:hypothetical protein
LPKYRLVKQPLHLGTLRASTGRFHTSPFLKRKAYIKYAKYIRDVRRRAKRLKRFQTRKRTETGGNGPVQPPANPAGQTDFVRSVNPSRVVRRVDGLVGPAYSTLGGRTFPQARDLAQLGPGGTVRYFEMQGNRLVHVANIVLPQEDPPDELSDYSDEE